MCVCVCVCVCVCGVDNGGTENWGGSLVESVCKVCMLVKLMEN